MPKLQDILKIHKEFGALEEDICEWIEQNKVLSSEGQHKEIYGCIKALSFSKEQLLNLSAYLMVRMGMARAANQGLRSLEPLVHIGHKNLQSRRSNAAKPRKGGRNLCKQKLLEIMSRYNKDDKSFDDFLGAVCCSPDDDMDVECLKTGDFKMTFYNPDAEALYKEVTLRSLYSKSRNIKK